jgi:signal transduction histidine kinase
VARLAAASAAFLKTDSGHLIFYSSLLAGLLLPIFLFPADLNADQGEEIFLLDQAAFVLSDSSAPPPDDGAWGLQLLPDRWDLSRPGVGGNGWYRVRFHLSPRKDRTYAVYLPRVNMNAAVFVNEVMVGNGGRFEEPVARNWNRAQFFIVPPNLLQPGDNTIHIRLRVYSNSRGGLSAVRFGEESLLRPAYERRFFIQTTLSQVISVSLAALAALVLLLWVRCRFDPVYGTFGFAALLWALRSAHYYLREIPISHFYWEWFAHSSLGWVMVLLFVFSMRYIGLRRPRFERGLWIYGLIGPALMFSTGAERLFAAAGLWFATLFPVGLFLWGILIRGVWRHPTVDGALLVGIWIVNTVLGFHDWLAHRNFFPFESLYWMHYGSLAMFLVIGWMLADRFVRTRDDFERLNRELEQRVSEKHAELEKNFTQLQQLERERAAQEERQRIVREVHDGVGSQIISTLTLMEKGQLAQEEVAAALRECLDDLRLVVDSLEPIENDLLTVLGSLRYRLEGRLKKNGIRLDWQVRDVPPLTYLTPENILHILRIVQELFANTLKHARADTIRVEAGVSGSRGVYIRVSDNGDGFKGERTGRGIGNMKKRAELLGGRLEIDSSSEGTSVRLLLPGAEAPIPPGPIPLP